MLAGPAADRPYAETALADDSATTGPFVTDGPFRMSKLSCKGLKSQKICRI